MKKGKRCRGETAAYQRRLKLSRKIALTCTEKLVKKFYRDGVFIEKFSTHRQRERGKAAGEPRVSSHSQVRPKHPLPLRTYVERRSRKD